MILQNILNAKGEQVHCIGPEASLDDVVQLLVRWKIGALVVCEEFRGEQPRVLGIVTERDVLRTQAMRRDPITRVRVREVMSSNLITASPDDRIEDAMQWMTEHRVRHLPIVVGNRLFGIVSIGDVVKRLHDQLARDNFFLQSYIRGEATQSVDRE
ncbi:MAG: CBS domain-containing protein [Planctomycetales bacterium]